jgi:hypothetical protein
MAHHTPLGVGSRYFASPSLRWRVWRWWCLCALRGHGQWSGRIVLRDGYSTLLIISAKMKRKKKMLMCRHVLSARVPPKLQYCTVLLHGDTIGLISDGSVSPLKLNPPGGDLACHSELERGSFYLYHFVPERHYIVAIPCRPLWPLTFSVWQSPMQCAMVMHHRSACHASSL